MSHFLVFQRKTTPYLALKITPSRFKAVPGRVVSLIQSVEPERLARSTTERATAGVWRHSAKRVQGQSRAPVGAKRRSPAEYWGPQYILESKQF